MYTFAQYTHSFGKLYCNPSIINNCKINIVKIHWYEFHHQMSQGDISKFGMITSYFTARCRKLRNR